MEAEDKDYLDIEVAATRVLNYLIEYIEEHHYPPSFREIQKALNLNSTRTVWRTLRRLQKTGYVLPYPHMQARSAWPRCLRVQNLLREP